MLIGILSDTHDEHFRTRMAVEALTARGAELLLHCGDMTTPGIVKELVALPLYFVFGNCDRTTEISFAAKDLGATCLGNGGVIEMAGKKIAMTHGHLHAEVNRLLMLQPDYLLSGHTHVADVWRECNTRRINPGALHRAPKYSVGLLNLTTDEFEFIEID